MEPRLNRSSDVGGWLIVGLKWRSLTSTQHLRAGNKEPRVSRVSSTMHASALGLGLATRISHPNLWSTLAELAGTPQLLYLRLKLQMVMRFCYFTDNMLVCRQSAWCMRMYSGTPPETQKHPKARPQSEDGTRPEARGPCFLPLFPHQCKRG